jgi:hypothetical protein
MIQGLVIPSPQLVQLARQEPEHRFLAGRLRELK